MTIADWNIYKSKLYKNQILWRYMSLDKFESFINLSSLYLCQINRFDDNFEGSISKRNFDYLSWAGERDQRLKPLINNFLELIDLAKYFTYASCWHVAEEEKPYMWNEYVPKNGGVAIKTSFQKLKSSIDLSLFNPVYIREIEYKDFKKDLFFGGSESVWPFFYKQKHYFKENELRILIQEYIKTPQNSINTNVEAYPDHLTLKVDTSILIDEIIVLDNHGNSILSKVKSILTNKKFSKSQYSLK